jgi:predicted dithiol-disulfide oxidoreductase (DUF899 family)
VFGPTYNLINRFNRLSTQIRTLIPAAEIDRRLAGINHFSALDRATVQVIRRLRRRDYDGETSEGEQFPVLNVFSREDWIHHRWASELKFVRGDNSPLDAIWPIWGVLDSTPNGRGQTGGYPSLQYE